MCYKQIRGKPNPSNGGHKNTYSTSQKRPTLIKKRDKPCKKIVGHEFIGMTFGASPNGHGYSSEKYPLDIFPPYSFMGSVPIFYWSSGILSILLSWSFLPAAAF